VLVENQRLLAGRGTQAEAIRYFVDNRPQHSPAITVQEVVDQMLAIKEKEGEVGQFYLRDLRAGRLRAVRAANPKRDPKKPCVYVGRRG
jgi:hypothetical protein